ncbi:MAG: hypothetical protein Q7S34_03485 [bacterium]|nr:hypothetical protein [bacterium]
MFIFAIDDKSIELEKAHDAIKAAGHIDVGCGEQSKFGPGNATRWNFREHILDNLETWSSQGIVNGIITDLMFHPGDRFFSKEREWPTGIYVVMFAISHNIPCVVCTSSEHGEGDFGRYFLRDIRITGPLVDMEVGVEKDWATAVRKLEALAEKQKAAK